MSQRANTSRGRKRSRRGLLWVFGVVVSIAALLYWEQAALLYVLSIFGVCALLLVVAFSDLDRGYVKSGTSSISKDGAVPVAGEAAPVAPPAPSRRALKRKPGSMAGRPLSG